MMVSYSLGCGMDPSKPVIRFKANIKQYLKSIDYKIKKKKIIKILCIQHIEN